MYFLFFPLVLVLILVIIFIKYQIKKDLYFLNKSFLPLSEKLIYTYSQNNMVLFKRYPVVDMLIVIEFVNQQPVFEGKRKRILHVLECMMDAESKRNASDGIEHTSTLMFVNVDDYCKLCHRKIEKNEYNGLCYFCATR